ncbi:MAG: acyl-CoA dehydrogenase [Proteobacteria bacterium]|nr:acyl-CoA dehydrogenase [Pseudomonadota bacterium]
MNFELSREENRIRRLAREFAEQNFILQRAIELEERHEYPFDEWKRLGQARLICVDYPRQYGGRGLSFASTIVAIAELCKSDPGYGMAMSLGWIPSILFAEFGSRELCTEYLPGMTMGNYLSGICFTEPNYGSDLTWAGTSAIRKGDYFVLNGDKQFITNGSYAKFFTVYAVTNPDAEKEQALSTMLVDRETKGVDAAEIGEKHGSHMTSLANVSFQDSRVPSRNLIGAMNRGFRNIVNFFNKSRIEIAAQGLGLSEGALEKLFTYAKKNQFVRGKLNEQATQHRIADMRTAAESLKLLIYKAASLVDRGKTSPQYTSMAKKYSGDVAKFVTSEACHIVEPEYRRSSDIEAYNFRRFERDSKIIDIYEGTKEIQKNIVAGLELREHGL